MTETAKAPAKKKDERIKAKWIRKEDGKVVEQCDMYFTTKKELENAMNPKLLPPGQEIVKV